MYWIKNFLFFLHLLSENDISGAQYTKERNVELEFTQGVTLKCHSYHIVQDSVCEMNENTTYFNLILSLTSTFGLNIDPSRSKTRVTIDDSGEPECNCKKRNLHIVKIIVSLYYPPDMSAESLGKAFNDAIIIAIIAPSVMIIFIVIIIMVIICNYQKNKKLKKLHLDRWVLSLTAVIYNSKYFFWDRYSSHNNALSGKVTILAYCNSSWDQMKLGTECTHYCMFMNLHAKHRQF